MGCSASRLDTFIAKAIEDPLSFSSSTSTSSVSSSSNNNNNVCKKIRSLSTPLVHHPAVKKGDSNHLVCLTSSTYGSLAVVDDYYCSSSSTAAAVEDDCDVDSSPDSVINTWELMEGLEDDESVVNFHKNVVVGSDCRVKCLNLRDFEDTQKLPGSKLGFCLVDDCGSDFKVNSSSFGDYNDARKLSGSKFVDCGSDFKVKGSNLGRINDARIMAARLGLDLSDSSSDFKVKSSSLRDFRDAQKVSGLGSGLHLADSLTKLSDSYVFVDVASEIVEEKDEGFELNPSTKPLWKHLSEESLLSKMDPNVGNAYERALLGNKMGYSQCRDVSKSAGSSPFVSKCKSMGSPVVVSKMGGDDNACNKDGCEDKIVLYFTSLRGIRKTFEDCSFVRMVLRGFRVVVDERDISMDSSFRKELQSALLGKAMTLPQLFIRGKHIGGADDVKLLHETGELERILEGCPTKDCGSVCQSCGDARFVPCSNCSGSRKVFQEDEGRTRKCPDCNENGLVRCPSCCL